MGEHKLRKIRQANILRNLMYKVTEKLTTNQKNNLIPHNIINTIN